MTPAPRASVLIVDDEESIRETFVEFLLDDGYEAQAVDSATAALELIDDHLDVVVIDIILPRMTGIELLHELQRRAPTVKVVLITGEPNLETATEAVRAHAFDYLSKPVTQQALSKVVANAARTRRLERDNERYRLRLEELVALRTRQLESYSERLRLVAEQTSQLTACSTVEELAIELLELIGSSTGSDGSCYLRRGDQLELIHSINPARRPPDVPLPPPPRSVIATVFERKSAFFVEDIDTDRTLETSGWSGYRDGSLMALPLPLPDGELRGVVTLHNKKNPPFDESDLELGRLIVSHGIEALRSLDLVERLRESESRYRQLADQSLAGIFIEQDGAIVFQNPKCLEMISDCRDTSFLELVAPEDRPLVASALNAVDPPDEPRASLEAQLLDAAEVERWIELLLCSPVEHRGRPASMGYVIDITRRKQAEHDHANVEEQLRQAQKMEAIGRLAGGVAHDFNNKLTGILGYTSLILGELADDDPIIEDLTQIQIAAEHASSLTQQLLAFSRKQPAAPRVVDPGDLVFSSLTMLERMLGEDIELLTDLETSPWNIRIDPAQLDQILFNLATNARDAMPEGGTLKLTTRNVSYELPPLTTDAPRAPVQCLELEISDSGHGIDQQLLPRIFEPFFTTKSKGKGTGLGLATVYGIVQQNHGHIDVRSHPDHGTTFTLWLPRAADEATSTPPPTSAEPLLSGTETILLVEDEDLVRELAHKLLVGRGYQVLPAANAADALAISERHHQPIHLLLTDIVMPQINGIELWNRLRKQRPETTPIFMSGYSQDILAQYSPLCDNITRLDKPFTAQTLALTVRRALDHPSTNNT